MILFGVSYLTWRSLPSGGPLAILIPAAPLALLLGSALFLVRGYEIAGGELLILRLLWTTPLSLDGLRSVEADPESLKSSLRLFGNGGLYSFTGLFRNKALGRYRAFVTDHRNAVVLVWDRRTVVISPDRPGYFVDTLRRRRGLPS